MEESDMEENDVEENEDNSKKPRDSLGFQVIAFYTDIEHKVENITDGTHIILQFDVNVKGRQNEEYYEDKDKDKDKDEAEDEDEAEAEDEDSEDEDEEIDQQYLLGGSGKCVLNSLKPLFPASGADTNRDAILAELVVMIKELHTSKSIDEVVFPLRYLYRLASIKPEHLKGVDGYLHEGLKKTFEVSLKPIVLIHQSNCDGEWGRDEISGFPFVSVHEEGSKRCAKKRRTEVGGDPCPCTVRVDDDQE